MKETRLQEIKRCLARAEELGGTLIESPYDLYVADVRYLVDMLEGVVDNLLSCYDSKLAKIYKDKIYESIEDDLRDKSSTQL